LGHGYRQKLENKYFPEMSRYTRRSFLKDGMAIAAGCSLPGAGSFAAGMPPDFVNTVTGPISPGKLGFTLIHEHIMVDFIGATKVSGSRYDKDEVFNKALPVLISAKDKGIKTIFECTPAYLGRDVQLLKRLSEATKINLITNTGYYGAAKEKYIPPYVYNESSRQIADRWIEEWKNGIDGSAIKPGFIKCGVDNYPLSQVQQKLIEAAAMTHIETGLTIGIHTGDGKAALEEMRIITTGGADPSAWIWIHAQNEGDRAFHLQVAKSGGWVSFDGFSKNNSTDYLSFLNDMKQAELLSRVMISQDAGWYHVGEPGGGKYRGYNDIPDFLVPAMKANGFTEQELKLIFEDNPAKAFSVSKRTIKLN
jgi:predicted metal-dependent phosphotriesterase family hydrolase